MGAEFLLYGYGLVCVSMLVFNLLYSFYLRAGDRRLTRREDRLRQRVEEQLEQLRQLPPGAPQEVQASHLTWMRRRLSHVNNLLAFDQLLAAWAAGDAACQAYLSQLQPVFLYLATVYVKRESTQAAYYCYFLAKNKLRSHMEMDTFQQVMLSCLKRDSFYCKLNALKALCSFGGPAALVEALTQLGDGEGQLHEKVITEALLSYKGDAAGLIQQLWARLDRFSLQVQRAVLDYIRFQSGGYGPQMLEILQDPRRHKELRLAAVRYFGKYPDPAARDQLLAFLQETDPARWEYAAISASSLAGYHSQEVTAALLQAMRSANWYVRNNAATSLEAQGLSYEEMFRVLGGDDRYAREMLSYRLEAKRLEQETARAAHPTPNEKEGAVKV